MLIDHRVHSIASASADPDDLDFRTHLNILVKLKLHTVPPFPVNYYIKDCFSLFSSYSTELFPGASISRKVKAVKGLRGGVPEWYVAQAKLQANAEIAEK